jgi:hypothetical protein
MVRDRVAQPTLTDTRSARAPQRFVWRGRRAQAPRRDQPRWKRSFPYSGDLIAVTYRPGSPAPYDPQRLVDAMRAAGRRGQ